MRVDIFNQYTGERTELFFQTKKNLVTERSVVYVVPFFIMIRIHVPIKVTV